MVSRASWTNVSARIRYPVAQAASVAVTALSEFLSTDHALERVLLAAYDSTIEEELEAALARG